MDTQFKTLQVERKDQYILIITLNRPDVRNAINFEMMQDLRQLWPRLYVETEKLRCAILTGNGTAFCAGADLKERNNLSLDKWQMQHAVFEQAMLAMLDCPIPIIAAVNGAAFGGGLELLLACDFAYAASDATFAQPEVKIGLMPGALGTQHLPRACGIARAKELALSGASFNTQEALTWGIINKICEPQTLMTSVLSTAHQICENAPLAVRQTKQSLNMSQQLDIKSGFFFELQSYYRLLPTKDREEGIRAFNETRKARFVGD